MALAEQAAEPTWGITCAMARNGIGNSERKWNIRGQLVFNSARTYIVVTCVLSSGINVKHGPPQPLCDRGEG
jgi:hypothetical protein